MKTDCGKNFLYFHLYCLSVTCQADQLRLEAGFFFLFPAAVQKCAVKSGSEGEIHLPSSQMQDQKRGLKRWPRATHNSFPNDTGILFVRSPFLSHHHLLI